MNTLLCAYTHVCAYTRKTYAFPEKKAGPQRKNSARAQKHAAPRRQSFRSAPSREELKEPGGQLFLQRPPPQPAARSDWSTIDTFFPYTLLCLARCHSEEGGVSEGAFSLAEECRGRSEMRFFGFFLIPHRKEELSIGREASQAQWEEPLGCYDSRRPITGAAPG